MENDENSSDSEEKMLEYNQIDYSQFMKPKPKATIHIGNNYQASLPDINEKQNQTQKKELDRFTKEIEYDNKANKRKAYLKAKSKNKTFEDEDKQSFSNKRRKIEEK